MSLKALFSLCVQGPIICTHKSHDWVVSCVTGGFFTAEQVEQAGDVWLFALEVSR